MAIWNFSIAASQKKEIVVSITTAGNKFKILLEYSNYLLQIVSLHIANISMFKNYLSKQFQNMAIS
jgi:hypothetical protein